MICKHVDIHTCIDIYTIFHLVRQIECSPMNSKREVGFQILVNFYCFFRINMLERHQTPIKSKCFILDTAETCH